MEEVQLIFSLKISESCQKLIQKFMLKQTSKKYQLLQVYLKKIFFLSELCLSILNPGIIGQCEEFIVSISEQIDKT